MLRSDTGLRLVSRVRAIMFAGMLGMLFAGVAKADENYAKQWAPPVGTELALLEAPDQTGAVQTFESLAGDKGLLLFFNRSADW